MRLIQLLSCYINSFFDNISIRHYAAYSVYVPILFHYFSQYFHLILCSLFSYKLPYFLTIFEIIFSENNGVQFLGGLNLLSVFSR